MAIGNPIRADGRFVELIRQADTDRPDSIPPRLAVNAIRIPSTESPHANLEKSPWGLADATWLDACIGSTARAPSGCEAHIHALIPTRCRPTYSFRPTGWTERPPCSGLHFPRTIRSTAPAGSLSISARELAGIAPQYS